MADFNVKPLEATLDFDHLRYWDVVIIGAAHKLDAVYELPYLAHATMEPMDCVVRLGQDACELWNGEQVPTLDQQRINHKLRETQKQLRSGEECRSHAPTGDPIRGRRLGEAMYGQKQPGHVREDGYAIGVYEAQQTVSPEREYERSS
jgi:CO/xanthine dehydrogenase Mo-binding subunit